MNKIFSKFSWVLIVLLGFSAEDRYQTEKLDSLKSVYWNSEHGSEKEKTLLEICNRYYSLSTDSLLKYLQLAEKEFPERSLEYWKLKNIYCQYLYRSATQEAVVNYADSLLRKTENIPGSGRLRLDIMLSKAKALIRDDEIQEAISYSFSILEKAEIINDTASIISSYSLLGWAYMEIGKYREAVEWMNKGFNLPEKENYPLETGILCSNNASCYNNLSQIDSGLFFVNISLGYFRQIENLTGMANAWNIRASMYLKQNKINAAQMDLENVLKVRQQIGDQLYLMADMAQLSSFYGYIGQAEKGIALAREGMALAEKSNNLSKKIFLTMALADNYKIAGHMKEYSEALETLIELKDSLAEKNSMEAIADMSAKYDLQKKENIIIQQKYSLNKNRLFAIGFVTLLLLGLVLVWALYRNYRLGQQKKLTSLLVEQKILSEKAVILAKENERKRISADLHDNLGAYAAAMTSNIKYLKEGKSENRDSLIVQLDENAQNIVTQLSETIWVLKHESLPLTTLADRFKVWLQRLMQSYPEVKYNYSEIIKEDIEFSPTNILHIFFIMKECVNNALRHSQCSEINIQIISTGEWMISIEDNGKGMGMVSIPHNRGISNIKSRAIQCGCIVAWKKAFKGGVIVTISGNTTNWVFSEMMTSHNFIPEKMQK